MANRRDFLKSLAGGTAAVTAGACTGVDPGKLIPYLVPADDIVPGQSARYSSVCRECPGGCGVIAKVREGRVIKLEGNPDHPLNRGTLCARGQASLQGTYNPDRIRQPLARVDGELRPIAWDEALSRLTSRLVDARVAWLGHHVSGSLDQLIDEWLAGYQDSVRVRYEPLSYEAIAEANGALFGRRVVPAYRLADADLVVSFGADFLETWLSTVDLTRQYAAAHRYRSAESSALHIHVAPRRGLTGENADRWLAVRPGSEALVAAALASAALGSGADVLPEAEREKVRRILGPVDLNAAAEAGGLEISDLEAVLEAIQGATRSVFLGGGAAVAASNATALEAACAVLNYTLGNIGDTVDYDHGKTIASLSPAADVLDLVVEMSGGRLGVLFLHHTNPAYTLPPDSGFDDAMAAVDTVVSFSSYFDETTVLADLVLPDHTPLESWGDHQPAGGIYGLQQPAMRPLFDTRATGDVLLEIAAAEEREIAADFFQYLRRSWRELYRQHGSGGFNRFWEQTLRAGGLFVAGSGATARAAQDPGTNTAQGGNAKDDFALLDEVPSLSFTPPTLEGPPATASMPRVAAEGRILDAAGAARILPLVVFPTLQWFDGRGANRPWLQELPDPVNKTTWTSWLELHPETAGELGVAAEDLVRARSAHGEIEVGVVVTPAIRPGVVATPLGQGHTEYGRYAAGRGANALRLLPARVEEASGAPLRVAVEVAVEPLGRKVSLNRTQVEESDHGRGIAQSITLAELVDGTVAEHGGAATGIGGTAGSEGTAADADLYGDHAHTEHRWGMTIDLDACVGCGACEVACAAENNLSVVGPEAVAYGREMSWIRIERYRSGSGAIFLPMLCQHCDRAPCESVCPVYATYHNDEGLNAMIYNRCVGTRYCSNNCPYKVRRFNWKEPDWPEPLHLQLNPDVTPRSKGVMEKCTFCVQRIEAGKRRAKASGREVADGEIVPACAQTCPADAIVFGDLLDGESRVRRTAAESSARAYRVLEEIGTRPAITYLKKVRRVRGRQGSQLG